MSSTSLFRGNPKWADVTPVEQDDGPEPVVPIAYTPQFKETMDYFRAILHRNELSQRAFELTGEVIELNSANYTAWYFRRQCLFALKLSLADELKWVQKQALTSPKNYQLWHHRRVLLGELNDLEKAREELDQIAVVLGLDAKNYHAWSHRQWLLQTFQLWDKEMDYIDSLLKSDIRNNSAWNQRFFVVKYTKTLEKKEEMEREFQYTKECIERVPNNESAWNYLGGLSNYSPAFKIESVTSAQSASSSSSSSTTASSSLSSRLFDFVHHISVRYPKCRHAFSLLLDLYEKRGQLDLAAAICVQLAEQVDIIRGKYWSYRKQKIEQQKKQQ